MIRRYQGKIPRIASSAFIEESAQVIGDVEVGENSSLWFYVVARGDIHWIRVGANSNIQDATVLHGERGRFPVSIGDWVTVGHGSILHGCTVEDHCLIGMGAIVLNNVRIGAGSIIGAGALIPENTVVPPGSVYLGVPGRRVREVTSDDRERIERHARSYIRTKDSYLEEARQGAD